MTTIGDAVRKVWGRIQRRRLPYQVTIRDFDKAGVRFEVSNLVEQFRVVEHGGETEYTAAMLGDLRSGDVLYDVGANVGMVTLHASKICRTIAFEPDPSFRQRLEANASLNPGRTFTLEQIAISDSDGSVDLYTDGADGNSPSLVHQRGEGCRVSVTARALDSLVSEGRLPSPTVIKLDIEGAEILALRGGARLLAGPDRPRALFIEVHDALLPGFGSSSDEVLQLLDRFGYTQTVYRAKRGEQTHLIVHSA
ncbi:MAG: FkbM family methyltransferase [Actinomycetota bacterium]